MTGGSRNYAAAGLFAMAAAPGTVDYFFTGQFLHNGIGIENPTASATPLHDDTDQWHGLGKITGIIDEQTRVSFIAGASQGALPDPQQSRPGARLHRGRRDRPQQRRCSTSASGRAPTSASSRCRSTTATLDFQLSGFARYSSLAYKPDPFGDLMFNGIAPWAHRKQLRRRRPGRRQLEARAEPHAARRLPGAARAGHQLQQLPGPAGRRRGRPDQRSGPV